VSTSEIYAIVASKRFNFTSEDELQRGIKSLLSTSAIPFVREFRLSPSDRLDFFCDGVVIETKVRDSLSAVTRQLHRYTQFDKVTGIVLVTTKNTHRAVPSSINNKPISCIWVGGAF